MDEANEFYGIRGIRKRPSMYIGGTDRFGLVHAVSELISNSIDQFLMGHGTHVTVTTDGNVVEVVDDGIGLPFDLPSSQGAECLASEYLTHIHRTGSADRHAPHIHLSGTHGVGIVAANAVCELFEVNSWRNGQRWRQVFECGVPHTPAKVVETGSGRGTAIRLIPDRTIFRATEVCADTLRARAFEAVHLFPGLRYQLNKETFFAPEGLAALARFWLFSRQFDNIFPPTPECVQMTATVDSVQVSAAAMGHTRDSTEFVTWVNGQLTPQGGSHKLGFIDALRGVRWKPAVAMLHVIMHSPEFAGPTRGKLDVPAIRTAVSQAIGSELRKHCKVHSIG